MSGDLDGKVVLITGANTGIGRAAAEALASRGASLYLACRSEDKARPVIDATGARFLQLDLGDLSSVRACAEEFLATGEPLHVLLNNAGLAGSRGMSDSGFEVAFGVNHVGHFLLTELLLPRLKESAPARVVSVSSVAHRSAKGIDFDAVRRTTVSRTGLPEYGVSKLANVLFIQELARRLEGSGVTTYALHPGAVATDVWRSVPWPIRPVLKLFMRSVANGAATSIYCAAAPEVAEHSGRYYEDSAESSPSEVATPELAAELWHRSADWVAAHH